MPARVSSRSTRASAAASSKPAAVTSSTSRASTASRASSAALEIPAEEPDNALRTRIAGVFRDAQRNTASHRKSVVTLRKIQEACCYEPRNSKKADVDVFDEDAFNYEFIRCVLRVMPIKKTESVGEKVIRFVGLFLRYANDKDTELVDDADQDTSVMVETPSSRLTSRLMETTVPLLTAKDKYVRFRSTQLISHIINSLEAIEDDLFQKLRHGLLRRVHDKEAMVRSQAALGLARLAYNQADAEADEGSDDDGDSTGFLEKLLEVLSHDPSAEVRRALLINLPMLPTTAKQLLERARDQDPANRRAVYSRILPDLGDFRHLSVSMREKLLRVGLRDRDDAVRKHAARLFRERWIEDCARTAGDSNAEEDGEQEPPLNELLEPKLDALLELLERVDVINSGVEGGVALEAMHGFWEGRPDYRDQVDFSDEFWETLSAESVFIARTFNDFCRSEGQGKYESLLEEKLPEVTKLAFYLERYIDSLVHSIKMNDEANAEEGDDDTIEQEFIVEQLLHIAITLDYSDEVGRRKMFALLRQSLSIPELPDEITKLIVNVLRDICAPGISGEKEFCSIVLEAVADVHDTITDDGGLGDDDVDTTEDSFHSAKSALSGDRDPSRSRSKSVELSEEEAREKAIKEITINMKCLHIVQCMLTNVAGGLQQNDHLVSMLNNLVVPAVRSHEAPVRERGLVCLGLCSLLDRSLAEENLTLFMHFFTKGHTALQITALQILTDILNVHGAQLLSTNPGLVKVYVKALKSGTKSPEVQAAATLAASKLLLGRVVTDPEAASELLKTLVVAYFDPSSAHNQSVRQALNYFLPVFCYSRADNQELMQSVALDALHLLFNIRESLEDDDADVDEDMQSLTTIGSCLVDWTDPRKCYNPDAGLDAEKKQVNGDVHLAFALAILDRISGTISKEEKKVVVPLLGKLYISPSSSEEKLRETYEEVSIAVNDRLISDTTGRNALNRIHVSLGKIIANLGEADVGSRRISRSISIASEDKTGNEDRTTTTEPHIKEEEEEETALLHRDEDSDEGTIIPDKEMSVDPGLKDNSA